MNIEPDGDGRVIMAVSMQDTEQLRRIVLDILPDVLRKFGRKNQQYGENKFELGAAGQFPEIWRKVKLLRAQVWDDRNSAFNIESPSETVDDLIGHLLMLKDMLAQEERKSWTGMAMADAMLDAELEESMPPQGPFPDLVQPIHAYKIMDEPMIKPVPFGTTRSDTMGHSIRVAQTNESRCPWMRGDPANGDPRFRQCVGVLDHAERFHLTELGEMWKA